MPADVLARRERPLGRSARFALVCFAATVMLVCYAFAVVSIALLSVLVAFEILAVLAAARFGLAGIALRVVDRHAALDGVFFRCVWLRRGPEFGFALERDDAPRLFEVVDKLCTKLRIALPSVVWMQTGVNAHVELKGFRRGGGKTILGLGYDLVAGLTAHEIEAVLAHEMAHAKLVQRGFSTWLYGGLRRLVLLSRGLSGYVSTYRGQRRTTFLGETFLWFTSTLTSLAAKLVANYSRQDEFDADRTAAGLCGVAAMRACLLKLRPLAEVSNRLAWRERVARLQSSQEFSQWLYDELASASSLVGAEPASEVFNEFSTHPALADRLAALGESTADLLPADSSPALSFLAKPDEVADKLVRQIQAVAAEQEQKDNRELKRLLRKLSAGAHLGAIQSLGVILALFGAIWILGAFLMAVFSSLFISMPMFGVGCLLVRYGRYRDATAMPSPDFGAMCDWVLPPNAQKRAEEIESALRQAFASDTKGKQRKERATRECYEALAQCDYLRAHVAASYTHKHIDSKSVSALMTLSIAAAALHDVNTSVSALNAVRKRTGFCSPSTIWAAGWTLALLGDWTQAEALLQRAASFRAGDATLHSLLALAQARRGKLQTAIANARRASTLKPGNNACTRQLTMLLLDAGFVREAQPRLMAVQAEAARDWELTLAMVRLHLLLGKFEPAANWSAKVMEFSAQPQLAVRLGESHELVRKPDEAAFYFRQALGRGFYPEACQGLGRIEAHKGNRAEAERYFLAALDMTRPVGVNGANSFACLASTLAGLTSLRDPHADCRGWMATLPADVPVAPLVNRSLLVFAPRKAEAEQLLQQVFAAIDKRLQSDGVRWREAPRDQQPIGPVRPGVQCVLS